MPAGLAPAGRGFAPIGLAPIDAGLAPIGGPAERGKVQKRGRKNANN